ncbi:hypothetical protein N0V88_006982 [Collariella sp. IMI 366227]|nr:hypothetical protein N0V88_006982 [Collariella sp. IMI 366227]
MDKIDPSMIPPGMSQDDLEDELAKYYYSCIEVSDECPVWATTLGYYPTRGVNIFLAIAFAFAMLVALTLGTWKRTWNYMAFIVAGSALELAGYAARIPLTDNPWNKHAFETQIVAIILAPTLICISIYLTLKHICLSLNASLSRIPARKYPFIFVPLDVSCLVVQAIGGGLAASGSSGSKNLKMVAHGNRINSNQADPEAVALWKDKKFRMFVYAVAGAYSGILIRCIYRIAEMAGGWGNHVMQDEPSFVVLEGFMILIPCVLLACFQPGFLFPQMAVRMATKRKNGDKSDAEKQSHPEAPESLRQPMSGDESGHSERQRKETLGTAPAVAKS